MRNAKHAIAERCLAGAGRRLRDYIHLIAVGSEANVVQ